MSGIQSRGRRGFTVVPNWRWEDETLDPYDLRVAGWIASHTDSYVFDYVTRNAIANHTHLSRDRVSTSLTKLADLGIIEVKLIEVPQSQGGKRFSITFDFDVWEGQQMVDATRPPRTPGDHPQDATRPTPGRPASTSGDSQEETTPEEQPPPAAVARQIATDWWEHIKETTGHAPAGVTFMALAKVIEPFVKDHSVAKVKQAMLGVYNDRRPFTRQVIEQYLDGRAAPRAGRQLDALQAAIDAERQGP